MPLKPRAGNKGLRSRSEIEEVEAGAADRRDSMGEKPNDPGAQSGAGRMSADLYNFLAALSYGVTSLAMVFLNKGVLMTYKHSMTLLTLQMAVSAVLIHLGGMLKWIQMKPFSVATARSLLALAFFYNANVAFALASLEGVNVPMYIALKRLTPMTVLIVGFFTGKGKPPLQVTLSVTTTVIGCIIAALGDFSFNPWAYAMGLTSVLFQTGYLVLVEKSGAEDGLNSFELLFYNAVLSLPVLCVLITLTGEAFVAFPQMFDMMFKSIGFAIAISLALVMGIVLNYTMFLCTICNSALTTTIVGVLKGVGSTTLGFFVLGGVEPRFLNVLGIVINTGGGIWYSIAKYRLKHPKPGSGSKDKDAEPLLPTSTAGPSR